MNDKAEPASADPYGTCSDSRTINADEVLVFDSSTFIREIGLMSTTGSALKHYLYCRGTELVVPQAAAEEYERHLAKRARGKIELIQKELAWLAQFCDGISGWSAPDEELIESRARTLARGDSIGAIFLRETDESRERARHRNSTERPPAHLKAGFGDCRIWEQCLKLLSNHDVVFVAADEDFRSRRDRSSLHPQLRAEAEEAGAGRSLTFHPDMKSLLHELKSEIAPIPDDAIFEFVYEPGTETMHELRANSECRPTATGAIEQTRLATEARDIIEVRLQVEDRWESPDGAASQRFELSGLCRYHLGDRKLFDLRTDVVRLLMTRPDGSVLAVKGSRAVMRLGPVYLGTPPLHSQHATLE
ncbi:MAG: hypothetical protein OXH59_06845 [Rhodospirillaceae bacterium]|nr:hypothetical protein [Rhodospirillaceae bacterium]